jgi:hypothetical protein
LGIALYVDRHGAGNAVVRQAAREVVADQRGEGALVIDERIDQVGQGTGGLGDGPAAR